MSLQKRIFTPRTIVVMRDLAGEGKSAAEIAEAIGSTAASVRVKCCQHKIKLSRRRHSAGAVRTQQTPRKS